MKRIAMMGLCLMMLVAVAWPAPRPTPKAAAKATAKQSDEAQIRQLLDDWKRAFEARDLEGIMKMYAPGDELVSFDVVPPLQYKGYAAYKKDYEEFLAMFDGAPKVEILEIHVLAGKDIAYGYGTERLWGTLKGGRKFDANVRWTDGFRKVGGRWKVVHEHISVPVDFATGKAVFDAK